MVNPAFFMADRWNLMILALGLCVVEVLAECPAGFKRKRSECLDIDECQEIDSKGFTACGENARCYNTYGSYYCQCADGYRLPSLQVNFTGATTPKCQDIDECEQSLCGPNSSCQNTIGSYYCYCQDGFVPSSGQHKHFDAGDNVTCDDVCMIDKTICGNGTCHHGGDGHYCACYAGFTNYGDKRSRCTALNCDDLTASDKGAEEFVRAHDLWALLEKTCTALTESESTSDFNGEDLIKRLLAMIDELLSGGAFNDNRKVSFFLDIVENTLGLIAPFIQAPGSNLSSTHTDLQLHVHKGAEAPRGSVTMSSKHARVDMQMETAAGDSSQYPGFATLAMLSYENLEDSAKGFFGEMKPPQNHSFRLNSKVVTVAVSNRNTSHLEQPIRLRLYHLKQLNNTKHCVFWDSSLGGGAWSRRGCSMVESNPKYTICSCNHLSSFAVLMALYDMKNNFELQLITFVGLALSLVGLFLCILTFSLIRSIQSPRTTIHLHLCISLFIAIVIFLAGISRTESRVGCAVVAGLLHFFLLAAFCWMCLEGVQLFRMVVLVFNTSFKTVPMLAGGYGIPAVIVAISAAVNSKGYGTERHCWLALDFIWSFLGPVCFIILVNIVFFLITAWKLAQKFSSLNPDLNSLQKIKAFTITAVAQLCVLGTMWIFGCFQFEEGTIVMSYLFTIFGSLQGLLLFIMHCLLSKQVREEYGNILKRCCAPQKKRYSEFSHSNSNSSKAHASKSTQDTGESHI